MCAYIVDRLKNTSSVNDTGVFSCTVLVGGGADAHVCAMACPYFSRLFAKEERGRQRKGRAQARERVREKKTYRSDCMLVDDDDDDEHNAPYVHSYEIFA